MNENLEAVPTSLKIVRVNYLEIVWSDGNSQLIRLGDIRKACPCATCREKKKGEENKPKNLLPVLTAAEAAPLGIVGMKPVGNYAYNVQFSDGHGSGIFPFALLRSLPNADDSTEKKT